MYLKKRPQSRVDVVGLAVDGVKYFDGVLSPLDVENLGARKETKHSLLSPCENSDPTPNNETKAHLSKNRLNFSASNVALMITTFSCESEAFCLPLTFSRAFLVR